MIQRLLLEEDYRRLSVISLVEIKKLISSNESLEQGLEEERKIFYSLLDHKNAKIGLNSFLNKTKANWED